MANTKLLIFENTIRGEIYVRLEMDFPVQEKLSSFKVDVLNIIEGLSENMPYLSVKFIDETGDFVSRVWIPPYTSFYLTYGADQNSSKVSKFKLSSLKYQQLNDSKMHPIMVELTLVSDSWESYILDTHSRSWSNVLLSDVVADIATEFGADSTDIQTTKETMNVLQPDWTNLQLLKWITANAESKTGRGQYMFSVDRNKRFIFKTMDECMAQKPKKDIYFNDASRLVQDSTPASGFNWFSGKQEYMPLVSQGGGGYETFHFDYETKTFKTSALSISDRVERQLSDWSIIADEHSRALKRFNGGRDTRTDIVASNRMLSAANSIQTLDFYIDADYDLNLGDIINVLMPTSSVYNIIDLNDQYAGYWMIYKLVNSFNVTAQAKITHLFLVRSGINGGLYTGLTKTATGKKLTK